MSEFTDSGNHKPRPWIGADGEPDEENLVQDFGIALGRARERCLLYPGVLRRARQEDERDPRPRGQPTRVAEVRGEFYAFMRRITLLWSIPFSLGVGSDPVSSETKETP